jgi:tetratricopeptide (TPR) repeat protein
MRGRSWRLGASIVAAIVLMTVLCAWLFRPQPTLSGVVERLASGHYDAVEGQLLAYLRASPQDQVARLMLARASVDRPDPKPELALEQLGGIRPPDRRWAAQVKSIEGEARFLQRRYDRAEAAWLEALQLDPKIAEVGWGLLTLYALQGREDESRRLALRLFEVEPDPHDRVQLLLQLIRHDAHAIAPGSVVHELGPVVRANPADLRSTLALGLALVHDSKIDEGLALLDRAVASHPDDPEVWDAYLTALVDAGQVEPLAGALDRLPRPLDDDARFDAARGWLAVQRRDWGTAVRAYRRAWEARPTDVTLAYRLRLALRSDGQQAELERLAPRLRAAAAAREKLRGLYDRIDSLPDLGRVPYPDLYRDVAATLEPLGRGDEARAWLRVAGSSGQWPVASDR